MRVTSSDQSLGMENENNCDFWKFEICWRWKNGSRQGYGGCGECEKEFALFQCLVIVICEGDVWCSWTLNGFYWVWDERM